MKTPIADFVRKYAESDVSRFHMPGHKGKDFLGLERLDITEIDGADVLGQAEGIINMSEENTSSLFSSAHSFFVTQGSTAAICAMLALVKKPVNEKTVILAARNVHKSFVNACALIDAEIQWLMPENLSNILECSVSADTLEEVLSNNVGRFAALYVTSPNYLGNMQNISEISSVCKKYGVLLLVDNAHGAYLKFLETSKHPLDLGADMCCDSAHKTLPVLTGGAYLHISKSAPQRLLADARGKISLFSSTSPSYLIMQSLDMCNTYLDGNYREELKECIVRIDEIKEKICAFGFSVMSSEPLKIVIDAKKSGYMGSELAEMLRNGRIEPEFCDEDFVVLMCTPQNSETDFLRLEKVFSELLPKQEIKKNVFRIIQPEMVMSVREAVFSDSEYVNVKSASGRVCAELTVSCPPAVPIAVSGERITGETADLFEKYGITRIKVVKRSEV